jgi:hypothetical protein
MFKYLLVFLFPVVLSAQSETDSLLDPEVIEEEIYIEDEEIEEEYVRKPYKAPPLEPLAMREVNQNGWDKATAGMDYSKDLAKPPKERKKKEEDTSSPSVDWTNMFKGLGVLFQVLAILVALGIIAYGVYWMLQAPRNRVIARDGTEITLANLDEYIHETDLDRFLREAIAAANWSLAMRIYFLQIIKHFSEQGAITWSKEKTNRDYIREMRNHRLGSEFREVVRQYERIWYGNQVLSAEDFERLEPVMKRMLG